MDSIEVKLELSTALMEQHQKIDELLESWSDLTRAVDDNVYLAMDKALERLDEFADSLEVDTIRAFELYRSRLREKYTKGSGLST